ncbi:collagen-like protein [Fortiea sp. LEGE XX443]|uniref:collagen-like protein n=1 Tax=Fortiea sp. LEGE XX443 TaxID=1828611 RepID=UPI00187DEE90|nr:collagen-like protein [Fortiea sp. LEGE XX443]MBE9004321.1 collagen-like protein [Fortiea sp. LEGE XX443]
MYKSLRDKLPVLLTFCLFTSLLPASGSVLCPAIANNKYLANGNYGRDGSVGTSGRSPRNGRDGQNQTIVVDGSSVNLDLSAQNGEDGEDGGHGYRPDCGYQEKYVNRDIHAPNGGAGGNGSKGGDGGNGGSLTAYYTNLADLRKVLVRAIPGEGGRGGRGGNGAAGCSCSTRSWEVETCEGTPGTSSYKCRKKTYTCYDGKHGSNGSNGKNGSTGRLGVLSIVQSKEPLATEIPSANIPITELPGKQFALSKNKWNFRTGATSLLAPGSIIADEYREFEQRLEETVQIVWQEKRPTASFGNQFITVSLNDNKQVEVTFPEDFWVDGSSKSENNLTTYTVNHAIPKQDVTRLVVSEFADSGKNLNLKIVDLAAKSDVLQTQFRIKFRARDNFSNFYDYETFYEGNVPPEFVTRDYNRFTLALGKLKIPKDALRSGINVDIEVTATRSLGERSAKQTINWRSAIR